MQIVENKCDIEIMSDDGSYVPFKALGIKTTHCRLFKFKNDKEICVSDDHIFLIDDNPIKAIDLSIGDSIQSLNGTIEITDIIDAGNQKVYGPLDVYGHKYVSSQEIINHNCQFVGSSTTLVDPSVLDGFTPEEPIEYKYGYTLKIFERPVENGFYLMGVDSATGSGLDFSVIQVIRIISRDEWKQVAVYADSKVLPGRFAVIIKEISDYYNNAETIIENNEIGKTVADECWYTVGMDRIINTDKQGIGTRSTKSSKLTGCNKLKDVLENRILTICDNDTIHELSQFEEVAPCVYRAPRGKHDDRVMALIWAVYATLQPEVDLDNLVANKSPADDIPPQTFFYDDYDNIWD